MRKVRIWINDLGIDNMGKAKMINSNLKWSELPGSDECVYNWVMIK